ERRGEIEALHHSAHGRRLAARDDQPVGERELLRRLHRNAAHACGLERREVFLNVALQREHADLDVLLHGDVGGTVGGLRSRRAYQPRWASSCSLGIWPISSPCIGAPISLLTSRMTLGSSK